MDFKFVPELYYDLLARVLPGALLIFSSFIALSIEGHEYAKDYNSIIVITITVLCAHYLSILLHEVWLWACIIPRLKKDEERKSTIASGIASIGKEENSVYILNRLMRAAAEIDGAESLIAGYGILSVLAVILGLYANAVILGIVMILFLFWRNSLIRASEGVLEINA